MNRTYRLVWSHVHGMLIAVAEIAGSRHKCSSPRRRRSGVSPTGFRLTPLAGSLALALGIGPTLAHALPTDGNVVAGQASVSQSGGTMNIHQTTDKAILNWTGFGIGSGETVNFKQPGAGSVALNRVLGGHASQIYGHLNANGQVFLVNPNGVYFAPGAQVNVGGLVASTLNISNSDFLNGDDHFSGSSTAGVENRGKITTAQGGYVAFIGHHVSNDGSIATPGGMTALGAGSAVDLTLAGNSLLSFKVSGAALKAQAENGGVIRADGGTVLLTAQAKNALLDTVVNNTGQIHAQTVTNHNGTIQLLGGDSGTVKVAGTLDASAPNGGDGGHIETSGTHLKVADGAAITTRAASGHDGTWLIDPDGFTIAATGGDISGATLSANLGQGNVTIQSTDGSGSDGNINVNDTVTWNQHILTLSATNDININTAMNGSGTAGLALEYGQGALDSATNAANYYVNAPVNLASTGRFSTKIGSDGPTVYYTIITSLGAEGSTTSRDLQGITYDARNYVLGANIDASPTRNWNNGAGFNPIGPYTGPAPHAFFGRFAGLGHTISNLYINRPNNEYVGLFGSVQGLNEGFTSKDRFGVVRDLGLVNPNITGGQTGTGGLIGWSYYAMVTHSYVSGGSVTMESSPYYAEAATGGLIGVCWGCEVADSHASIAVHGVSIAGGLIGLTYYNPIYTDIIRSYATGNVSAYKNNSSTLIDDWPYALGRATFAGGLIGWAYEVHSIDQVYATGNVSANGNGSNEFGIAGGLVGGLGFYGGLPVETISNAYATGTVTADQNVGGIAGWAYDGIGHGIRTSISNVYFSGHVKLNLIPGHLPLTAGIGPILGSAYKAQVAGANRYYDANHFSQDKAVLDPLTSEYINVDPSRDLPVYSTTSATNGHDAYTQASYASFDFKNIWWMAPGSTRPILRMEHTSTISNAHQLQLMAMDPGAHYTLANNIDLTSALANASGVWNPSAGFAPVGSAATPFTGSFDGQGHTLSGLNIQQAGSDNVGLFGAVGQAGTIRDVGLVGGSVTGGTNVGALAGVNAGTISDAYATGSVSGTSDVGGLVGANSGAATGSYATGSVSGSTNVGGLFGTNSAELLNAYATSSVTGTSDVGGLVGANSGTATGSYATGNVTGSNNVGGLFGTNSAELVNAHASGSVNGTSDVGGLVGANSGAATGSYATGSVSGSTNVGGLFGSNSAELVNAHASGSVTGTSDVGGLVGANAGRATGSYASGNVSGSDNIGGLFGTNSAKLDNAHASGSVNGTSDVGGLVGDNSGTATGSYATGDVTGSNNVGGLFGTNSAELVNAHASGSVTGTSDVGGLVGANSGMAITTHATGNVKGNFNVGGLFGINSALILNAYTMGSVSGNTHVGGLVGANSGAIYNGLVSLTSPYWDTIQAGYTMPASFRLNPTRSYQLLNGPGKPTAVLFQIQDGGGSSSKTCSGQVSLDPFALSGTGGGLCGS